MPFKGFVMKDDVLEDDKKGDGSGAGLQLKQLLGYGRKAKETMYYGLLKKIQAGKVLSATEQRTFTTLDTELNVQLAESELDAGGHTFTNGDAAKYLGYSRRMLSYHIHRGHLRQEPDGTFLKEELDNYLNGEGRSGDKTDDEGYQWKKEQADLALRQARAARERFMVKQLESQYAPVAEVAAAWAGRMKEFCSTVRAWKNNLSILLANKAANEIKEILDREAEAVILAYVRDGKWTPTTIISTED